MFRAAALRMVYCALDALLLLPVLLLAAFSRWAPRAVDIGLGPRPLVNNPYHARALRGRGYRAETFVNERYYITDDFDHDLGVPRPFGYLAAFRMLCWCLINCRSLLIYFDGGALADTAWLWRTEPLLYRLAGVRTVVLAYGSDVQDLTRTTNLLFKHGMGKSYPGHRHRRRRVAAKVDLWTRWGDHVVAGADWVEYLYHWDSLQIGHFSIDTERWVPQNAPDAEPAGPLRVLHAPNHRALKGTEALQRAAARLCAEGVPIELTLLERVPNDEVRAAVAACDVVVDQLVIGWYAMFAIEGMASGKPVVCHVRPDLENFYIDAGLLEPAELPLVRADVRTIESVLRSLATDTDGRRAVGVRSRAFVETRHSLDRAGHDLEAIFRAVGVAPCP